MVWQYSSRLRAYSCQSQADLYQITAFCQPGERKLRAGEVKQIEKMEIFCVSKWGRREEKMKLDVKTLQKYREEKKRSWERQQGIHADLQHLISLFFLERIGAHQTLRILDWRISIWLAANGLVIETMMKFRIMARARNWEGGKGNERTRLNLQWFILISSCLQWDITAWIRQLQWKCGAVFTRDMKPKFTLFK